MTTLNCCWFGRLRAVRLNEIQSVLIRMLPPFFHKSPRTKIKQMTRVVHYIAFLETLLALKTWDDNGSSKFTTMRKYICTIVRSDRLSTVITNPLAGDAASEFRLLKTVFGPSFRQQLSDLGMQGMQPDSNSNSLQHQHPSQNLVSARQNAPLESHFSSSYFSFHRQKEEVLTALNRQISYVLEPEERNAECEETLSMNRRVVANLVPNLSGPAATSIENQHQSAANLMGAVDSRKKLMMALVNENVVDDCRDRQVGRRQSADTSYQEVALGMPSLSFYNNEYDDHLYDQLINNANRDQIRQIVDHI